jgi:hypothetical protein
MADPHHREPPLEAWAREVVEAEAARIMYSSSDEALARLGSRLRRLTLEQLGLLEELIEGWLADAD